MVRLAGCLMLCGAAFAAEEFPTPRQVLSRVTSTYSKVLTFHITELVTNRMIGDAPDVIHVLGNRFFPGPPERVLDFAFSAPGQIRVMWTNPHGGMVAGAPESFKPIHDSFYEQQSRKNLANLGVADYTQVEHGLTEARVLRREDVDLEESRVSCWVVGASYKSGARRTFWVDMERSLVLKEVQITPAQVEHTVTIQKLSWNQPLDPSLFDPPAHIGGGSRGVVRPDPNGVTPPVPVGPHVGTGIIPRSQCYDPAYTDEAAIAGMAGNIEFDFVVDVVGKPAEIRPANVMGLGLDEMAAACLARWRFTPAQKDGQPIVAQAQTTMHFNQYPHSHWHLARAEFQPDGVSRPVFLKAHYPGAVYGPAAKDVPMVTVLLELTIDRDGVPRDIQPAGGVDQNVDPKMVREAAAIVSKWVFTPGSQDGQPVSVTATFELVFSAVPISAPGVEAPMIVPGPPRK